MDTTPLSLQDILKDSYGITATPVGGLKRFDLTHVTVYESYPDKSTVKNYGYFDVQRFKANEDGLYNVVICSEDFPHNDNLLAAMKDDEDVDVKEYELISPAKPVAGYFLYKLVPHMVEGKPVWS